MMMKRKKDSPWVFRLLAYATAFAVALLIVVGMFWASQLPSQLLLPPTHKSPVIDSNQYNDTNFIRIATDFGRVMAGAVIFNDLNMDCGRMGCAGTTVCLKSYDLNDLCFVFDGNNWQEAK